MNRLLFFCVFAFCNSSLFAQDKTASDIAGQYQVEFYKTRKINILSQDGHLIFELLGQGKAPLVPVSPDMFAIKGLAHSTVEFIRDSLGQTTRLVWKHEPFRGTWKKLPPPRDQQQGRDTSSGLGLYAGRYAVNGNSYQVILVRVDSGQLLMQLPGEVGLVLSPAGQDHFQVKSHEYVEDYTFIKDKSGTITGIKYVSGGALTCVKVTGQAINPVNKHRFTHRDSSVFTEADSLQGFLSSLKTCYDVQFYDLKVKVDPDTKSIQGNSTIRFRATRDFTDLQVDLFANMKIEKIVWANQSLSYTRKYDAVMIHFPELIPGGSVGALQIFYSGTPQVPDMSTLSGGFIWLQDRNGKPWIEVVSQGSGASLWWPCKDNLSDKPDSMSISVTVPSGLMAISNGEFVGKSDLAGNLTEFGWKVHYPINTYNAVLYIGDYIHFSDSMLQEGQSLALNYYCLSYNRDIAEKLVRHVKPILSLYQNDFGPYPFVKDGFALVESPYGMEHQSAVSVGPYLSLQNGKPSDSTELTRILWHETAHEWWGNSLTCSDYAEFWIHESFASYAEILCIEAFEGQVTALKYLQGQASENKSPIIGFYGVNDFHMGDMYSKGARMIATLRATLNNDSVFFAMLRGLQRQYKYQVLTTSQVVDFVNQATAADYRYLFDQYLRYPAIPKLDLQLTPMGKDLQVRYKWTADVSNFRLPVQILKGRDGQTMIFPTTQWQSLVVKNCKPKAFSVDNSICYFEINVEK